MPTTSMNVATIFYSRNVIYSSLGAVGHLSQLVTIGMVIILFIYFVSSHEDTFIGFKERGRKEREKTDVRDKHR